MEKDRLEDRAEKLEDALRVLSELGLFNHEATNSASVVEKIELARKQIDSDLLPEAATALTLGERKLQGQLEQRSRSWRWIHIYQLPIGIYYLLVFGSLLMCGLIFTGTQAIALLGVPTAVVVAGSMGAVLRGTWWLHRQVAQRIYRPQFVLAHLLAPFIGALFGMLAFLLLRAGVLSLGASEPGQLSDASLPRALAFLSGFSWEWMIEKLDRARS